MEIEVSLFGAFRPFGDKLTLSLPENATVAELGVEMKRQIHAMGGGEKETKLLAVSRFATDKSILNPDAPLSAGMTLAVIPPVSGG